MSNPPTRIGAGVVTRLLPLPDADAPHLDGALALVPRQRREQVVSRPDLRLVDGGQPELSGTRAWTQRYFQALVEVLGGDRNPHQLLRSTSYEVFVDVVRRVEALNQVTPVSRPRRRLRAQVRSVHVCLPSPSVAEVCARVQQGPRSRAIAGRLELVDGRWQCTALEFG